MDETTTTPAAPAPEDPYDLGDTGIEAFVKPAEGKLDPSSKGVGANPSPSPADERPRNPDGTFARTAPLHPQYLKDQALEFGFSEDDLAEMPTEALHRTVLQMAKNRLAFRSQQDAARTVQGDGPKPEPPPAPEPAPDDLGLDENLYDPGLIGILKKQAKELAELRKVKGVVDNLSERETKRETSRAADLLDGHFEALGPEFKRIFGDGPAGELTDADAMKRRIAVLNEAGINLSNVTTKSLAKIKAAAELLYKAPAEAKAPEPYADAGKASGANGATPRVSPEDWAKAGLAKPTQRAGAAEPKGEELAKANLAKRFREEDQVGDADIADGLL
jgi:hypothetical protein